MIWQFELHRDDPFGIDAVLWYLARRFHLNLLEFNARLHDFARHKIPQQALESWLTRDSCPVIVYTLYPWQ